MKKKCIVAALAACAIVLAGCKVVSESSSVAVESVTLNAETLTLEPSKTRKLMATVTPSNADDKTVAWSSSNADVAAVDSSGTVTAYKVGTTTITAKAGGKQATCEVTVKSEAVAVESVTLNVPTLALTPNITGKLTATVTPSDAGDKTVTWRSSDTAVATVSNDGTVTAVAEGTATITAKAGDKTATCEITVKLTLVAVENVTLDPTSLTLTRGETGKLSATVTPDDADNKTVTWSSSDTAIATVNKDGTVTAIKAGDATITAQAGEITTECTVTVNPILVKDVTLDKATLTLTRGETGKLTATVTPNDADDKSVAWSSSDTSVAKVGDDGIITAIKIGNATITAQADGKKATCAVTVNPILVKDITLDITTDTLEPSMTRKLTATVKPDNADDKTVEWSSSNLEVATVDDDGTVTAVGAGEVKITAQAGDKQATCLVTVRTDHSYSGGKCTVCGRMPIMLYGVINNNGVLIRYNGLENNVVIPDGVTGIGDAVFNMCSTLTNVTIPNSVTSIGFRAFDGCSKLTSVKIPDSVTSIGSCAFSTCSSLTDVTIPKGVTSIGAQTFYGCRALTDVTIPDSVTSIGSRAFEYCTSLTDIMIPDSVTSIGSNAFSSCTSLASVTIPNSVTSIRESAFSDCTSLVSVNYTGTESQWNDITKGENWDSGTGSYTITYNYKE